MCVSSAGENWSSVLKDKMFKFSKYKNKKVEIDGITFDSKAEGRFYELKKQEILELQPKIYMTKARILYKPDFKMNDGTYVDVKGMQTPVFKIKKRLWKVYMNGDLHIVKVYLRTNIIEMIEIVEGEKDEKV